MIWFKHLTDSYRGQKMMAIKREFGLEGYGRYWTLIEMIAEKWNDPNEPPSLEYSWSEWASFLGVKQKKLRLFLELIEKQRLINTEETGNVLKITSPKLLEVKGRDFGRARPERGSDAS